MTGHLVTHYFDRRQTSGNAKIQDPEFRPALRDSTAIARFWNDNSEFTAISLLRPRAQSLLGSTQFAATTLSLITPAFLYSFDALVLRLQFFSLSKLVESFLDEVLCAHISDRRDLVIEPANLLLIR